MNIDKLLAAISDASEDDLPSIFAEAVVSLVRAGGQSNLRDGLRSLEGLSEMGELDELIAAIEDWTSET